MAPWKCLWFFLDDPHRGLEIAEIVEGVEHAKDVDPVVAGALDEGLHHVVGVVLVAHQVLAAQQHRKGRVLDVFFQRADAFPGVLTQIAVHAVESGAAPNFHGVKAHLVHQFRNVEQILGAAAGGEEGLMPVAERQVLNFDRIGRLGTVGLIAHRAVFQDAMFMHGVSFYLLLFIILRWVSSR